MKIQETKKLSSIYPREENFSADLANQVIHLGVGNFADAEVESRVGTRRADIVATGDDGVLVVENQFGKADWDHWGRLEAYARLKEADVAALVAESFEELMMVTCNLRNEDSQIDWYLIKAEVNTHDELSFHHVSRPAIDIQTQKNSVEYSEFWGPIRLAGLFAGKQVAVKNDGWISKSIRGIELCLVLQQHSTSVQLYFRGDDRIERRDEVTKLFPASEYTYRTGESPKAANIVFPAAEKGRKDNEHWPEVREKLVGLGKDVYNRLLASDV